jgi:hypothetical protein
VQSDSNCLIMMELKERNSSADDDPSPLTHSNKNSCRLKTVQERMHVCVHGALKGLLIIVKWRG